jgi:HD-GYP domain-containing protein (c-di-GMP phosphodiesterase class II)
VKPKEVPKTQFRSKDLLDILIQFYIVLKLAKVFEPNNRHLIERITLFFSAIRPIFQNHEDIQIQIQQDSVFINGIRLKFDFSTYHIFKFVLQEFQGRQIGSLSFISGLTEEEFVRFMIFLARKKISKDNPFEQLAEDFRTAAFRRIQITKISDAEQAELSEKNAMPTYFLGICHMKQLFKEDREGLNLYLTKRWIQSIYNHITNDESFLFGLLNIKNFEEYTLNHSVNVCILCLALGRRLGLTRKELVELGISAALHDVGKLDVPKEILEKPGKLDPQERAIIERHSHLGAIKLLQLKADQDIPLPAIQVALEHHCKADLSGYPKYIRRTHLTLYSKIVKIADYYDAITTKRVYRSKAFTHDEAIKLMLEKRKEEFDPIILEAFIRMMGLYPIGSLVLFDTGEIGIVFENNPHFLFAHRPKVKLITDALGNKMDGPVVDLTEVDADPKKFKRKIIKSLDQDKYDIQVADYFLARVQD